MNIINVKKSTDYGYVAWLTLVKEKEIIDARKVRRGKMEYAFDMQDEEWLTLRLEYSNSIFPRFLQEIKLKQDPSF